MRHDVFVVHFCVRIIASGSTDYDHGYVVLADDGIDDDWKMLWSVVY